MVLLRATRAGRSASPFLSSFCQNCKLIVRKLHNSANVERIDTKCKFNKFQSDHCSGTMEDSKYNLLTLPCIFFCNFHFIVSKKINELIGLEIGFNTIPKCRANLLKFQPKAQDLPSRSMKDSFTTAVIPLSSASTQEHYINHLGRLRIGRITEELDMFAGKRLLSTSPSYSCPVHRSLDMLSTSQNTEFAKGSTYASCDRDTAARLC